MDILQRIKQLVLDHRVEFTEKAQDEMDADGLTQRDVVQSIMNAQSIYKMLRSRSSARRRAEKLYVIKSFDYSGTLIYTKGGIGQKEGQEVFYILVSAKIATFEE